MRKIKDYYFYKAKKEKYPARSVYKLQEIDEKYHIIKRGFKVLDLGCSPGSWSKYCSSKVGKEGLVIGMDKGEPKIELLPNMRFYKRDILKTDLDFDEFDVVLSDMAPSTSGIKEVDQAKSMELARAAFSIAEKALKEKGHFVCKIFQGPDIHGFIDEMKRMFEWVKITKPLSVRKESLEVYIVGYGRRDKTVS